jgi:hypothetical protein
MASPAVWRGFLCNDALGLLALAGVFGTGTSGDLLVVARKPALPFRRMPVLTQRSPLLRFGVQACGRCWSHAFREGDRLVLEGRPACGQRAKLRN